MAYPKAFRNKLSITQKAFAMLIGCTEGQLSMAESGKRELPWRASSKVSLLEIALLNVEQNPPQLSQQQPIKPSVEKKMGRLVKIRLAKQLSLQLKLEQIQEKTGTLQLLLQVCNHLKDNPDFSGDKLPAMQLTLLARKAEQQLNNLFLKQIQLQITMAGLEAELGKANELLGTTSK